MTGKTCPFRLEAIWKGGRWSTSIENIRSMPEYVPCDKEKCAAWKDGECVRLKG